MEAATSDTDPELFEKDLQFALDVAALAPSSHNVQPWSLARATPESADVTAKLVLALDRSRCLRALPDAHELEMHLSCGAYLEAMVTGLAACGWQTHVSVPDAARETLPEPLEPLATIWVTGALDPTTCQRASQRCAAARDRRTHRGPYREVSLPVEASEEATQPECLAFPQRTDAVWWQLVDSPASIEKAADFVSRHAAIEFTHAGNWAETYRCMRFSDAEDVGDGMPIVNLLGPIPAWQRPVLKALLSPIAMRGLGRLGLARSLAGQFGEQVEQSSALLYGAMSYDDADLATRLEAGAQMFVVWLGLSAQGLSVHPVSVVLQHETLREEFQRQLDFPAGRGFFFARVGYPTLGVAPMPRRPADARSLIRI